MEGSTDENKGHAFKPKRYRGEKMQTKTQGLEIKANTNFKVKCSGPEGYILDLGLIDSDKFTRTMN